MNHYARSFEKFSLKALTWETANQNSNKYDMKEFMNRAYGSELDPVALVYSCAVRAEINQAIASYTGDQSRYSSFDFLLHGSSWSRYEEFVKPLNPQTNISIPDSATQVSRLASEGYFIDYYA